jgi:hypothetical protein
VEIVASLDLGGDRDTEMNEQPFYCCPLPFGEGLDAVGA